MTESEVQEIWGKRSAKRAFHSRFRLCCIGLQQCAFSIAKMVTGVAFSPSCVFRYQRVSYVSPIITFQSLPDAKLWLLAYESSDVVMHGQNVKAKDKASTHETKAKALSIRPEQKTRSTPDMIDNELNFDCFCLRIYVFTHKLLLIYYYNF